MYQINWAHFTNEERGLIEKIIKQGEYQKITKLIVVNTREQENEITKFIESVAPTGRARESAIKEQIKMLRVRGEEPILTPEQEAEWQRKIDEEANPVQTAIAQNTEKLKQELTEMGVGFPASASYEQLKAIKEEAVRATTEAPETSTAPVEAPVVTPAESETISHTVTEEDLEANPELKDDGVKVGDVIQLPKVEEVGAEEVKPKKTRSKSKK